MAQGIRRGFSKPYIAPYDAEHGTYSTGMTLRRGVSLSSEVGTTEVENWYADNKIAESSAPRFTDGTLTVTCDDPSEDAIAMLYTTTVNTSNPTKYLQTDTARTVGFGCVVEKQYLGTVFYEYLIFPNVKFEQISEVAETETDSVTWSTIELTATIGLDASGAYKITPPKGVTYATEADAVTAMVALLG